MPLIVFQNMISGFCFFGAQQRLYGSVSRMLQTFMETSATVVLYLNRVAIRDASALNFT